MNDYRSYFSEYIQGMLDARSILGYSNEAHATALYSFDRYCAEQNPECRELTEHLVMSWLPRDNNDIKGVQGRASAIRLLARYTYLFTSRELSMLFAAIDSLPEDSRVPHSRQMLPVLFRLIYTCGLRPREGRELKRRNINLDTGEILITNTKKKKERFVVMSDDMLSVCKKYEKMRQFFYEDNPYFFPGSSAGPMDGQWLNREFHKCWRLANPGIPKDRLPSVRIYTLRHQFASANLNRWLDEGKDLEAMLPRLRAYMGHYTLAETAHYIHLIPESLVKNKGIDWKSFSGMIPEVEPWEE